MLAVVASPYIRILTGHDGYSCATTDAKAGIEILTQHLATQVGPYGIRVNCIAPETILTERNISRIPEAQKKSLVDAHPIKRLGTPEDIARAALFLVSEDARNIAGQCIHVDGGAIIE